MDHQKPDNNPPKKPNWKRFQRLSIDKRALSRRASKVETATVRHARELIFRRLDNILYVRRHVVTWFVAVAVVLLGILGQFLLSGKEFTQAAPVSGGTFAEGVVGALDTLNPLQASTSAEVAASRLMFSSLYNYDETGKLHPDLAETMSINDSGEIYTVKIREDAKWHDGRDVTAEDVVFTLGVIKNPESRSRSSLRTNWQDISVDQLNRHTVKFTLPAYAAFPHALTFPVVPKHLLSSMPAGAIPESAFASAPVGSGPFVFSFLQDADIASMRRTVHMTANANYYQSMPKLNRFELNAYPDEQSLTEALRRREVTAAADLKPESLEGLSDSVFTIKNYTLDNGVYLLFNTSSDVLKDSKVRRALQAGIDTEAVLKAAGDNMPALHLPVLESHLPGEKLPKPAKASADRAQKLFKEAGWKLNDDKLVKGRERLSLELTTIKNKQFEAVVNELERQLRLLGVDVTKKIIDDRQPGSNFRQNVLQQRNYDMLVYELPIGADPDVYAYWHSSQLGTTGYNFTNYSNGVSDAALVSARDRTDQSLRSAKYLTFADQWLKDVPAIGLYQQVFTYAVNQNATALGDDTQLVLSADRYSNVERWTVGRGTVYKTP